MKNRPIASTLFLALCCSGAASAGPFDDPTMPRQYKDFTEEQWQEAQVALPPFPEEGSLIEFYVSPTATSRFFIDESSLNMGGDGVVRYALVTKGAGGAVNVSYEGIRCATRERRLYALGRGDRTWTTPRTSAWSRIGGGGGAVSPVHMALAKEYFCPAGERPASREEALASLKRGRKTGPLW
ncbi:MAG: CNP1-like family protein [Pseudomonadota bacterium]|jgi:hypothetical protein